jgi:hypothetical protein
LYNIFNFVKAINFYSTLIKVKAHLNLIIIVAFLKLEI